MFEKKFNVEYINKIVLMLEKYLEEMNNNVI